MKPLYVFPTMLLVFWGCTSNKPDIIQSNVNDSLATDTAKVVLTQAEDYSVDTLRDVSEVYDEEDVYAGEGEDFTGDAPDNMDAIEVREEVVHFVHDMFSSSPFAVGLFSKNQNAIDEVPSFLKSNNIEHTVNLVAADPESDESTDVYTYSFGESVIEIAYGTVVSAQIFSPLIELEDGVKVGMSRSDFINRFSYLINYSAANTFQLHTSSLRSACTWTFQFEDDKISSMKLEIFIQDCG